MIVDFILNYIIGNLLQMIFRFWSFRRWVFPEETGEHERIEEPEIAPLAGEDPTRN